VAAQARPCPKLSSSSPAEVFLLAFCLAAFRSVGQYEVAVSALNNFNAMFAPK
jgi:hypothetical protein